MSFIILFGIPVSGPVCLNKNSLTVYFYILKYIFIYRSDFFLNNNFDAL